MTEKPNNVRVATPNDEEKLFKLLMEAYEENAVFGVNPRKVYDMIRQGTEQKGGIIGVIDSPDKKSLAGSIGMLLMQWWYTDDWHLDECWNFVQKDHRKSENAKNLINFAKWASENMQLALHLGIVTTHRVEAKMRLYRRQLPQTGAFFMYNMETGNGPLALEIVHGGR